MTEAHPFGRPLPPGGGGMRDAHEGGAGAGFSSKHFLLLRHPLSPPLARRTAPPNGGARTLIAHFAT
jgi:hypothetical protein